MCSGLLTGIVPEHNPLPKTKFAVLANIWCLSRDESMRHSAVQLVNVQGGEGANRRLPFHAPVPGTDRRFSPNKCACNSLFNFPNFTFTCVLPRRIGFSDRETAARLLTLSVKGAILGFLGAIANNLVWHAITPENQTR